MDVNKVPIEEYLNECGLKKDDIDNMLHEFNNETTEIEEFINKKSLLYYKNNHINETIMNFKNKLIKIGFIAKDYINEKLDIDDKHLKIYKGNNELKKNNERWFFINGFV